MKLISFIASLLIHISLVIPFNNIKLDKRAEKVKFKRGSVINVFITSKKKRLGKSHPLKKTPIVKKKNTIEKKIPPKPKHILKGIKSQTSIIAQSPPEYPYRSRILEEEGLVILDVFIAPNGTLANYKIIQSSGYKRLDKAAIQSVSKYRFAKFSGMSNEKLTLQFNFSLD